MLSGPDPWTKRCGGWANAATANGVRFTQRYGADKTRLRN
jgi:hypothetical protein